MSGIPSFDSLSALVAFSITVESGSFSSAGRKLGLSASAVSKAVDRLEQRLGVTLLTRTTRSLSLTGEGDVLYRHARRVLVELQHAEEALHLVQKTPRGRLKVSVPTVLGRRVVVPAMREFMARYPEIMIELSLDDVKVDLIDGGYDLAIRLGELEDSDLRARVIGPHAFITCASPEYLSKHGTPRSTADLVQHCCIQYRFPTTGRPEIWAFKNQPPLTLKPGFVLNDGESLASAALAGIGIIQAPRYLVRDDVTNGRLISVLTEFTNVRGNVSIVWPAGRSKVPRVRAFVEFISQCLAEKI
jgi:DNA-binding transcriptional LysR family regulator